MRKVSKVLTLVLTFIFMTVSFGACSKSDKQTGSEEKVTTSAGSGGDAAKAELKGDLELYSTKTENATILQTLVDKFTKANPGVKITLNAPSDGGTVLRTRLAKNDIPDIIACGGDKNYTLLESNGKLTDLSSESYIGNIQESYLQMLYDVNKNKEQKVYGIPYATNASGILYNMDLFKKANVQIPKTWDQFLDVIGKLEAAGIKPFVFTFKDTWTTLPAWNSMAPDLMAASFTTDRLANKVTFADTHTEVLDKYLQVLSHSTNDIMGTTYAEGNNALAQGTAAMMINGNWAIPEMKKVNQNCNIDLFAFPASNDESKNYVTSGVDVLFAVSSATKYSDAAKAFIAFMAEKDNAQAYISDQFAFSAIKGVEQSDPTVAGVKKDISEGKVANFPDHYYPSGFDLASALSEFALNYTSGMDNQENTKKTLANLDTLYDAVNVAQ